MSFRQLLTDAVNEKFQERIPHISSAIASIADDHEMCPTDQLSVINEMALAVGLKCKEDSLLFQCIKELPSSDAEDDYAIACLLMTFAAVSIPEMAKIERSTYNVTTHI